MKRELPKGKAQIYEFFWGMRIFDTAGAFCGRLFYTDPKQQTKPLTMLFPDGSTKEYSLADYEHSTNQGFWLCQPSDPAVIHRWLSAEDPPEPAPGQSFEDGHALGVEEAENGIESWSKPPSWLFEPLEPPTLTGNAFNDGFLTGISTTNYKLLKEKFKEHSPPETTEKNWQNQKFGIDPQDAKQVISYQAGHELAQQETEWLPRLNAGRRIDTEIQHRAVSGKPVHAAAFRFGFLAGMEAKFPNRY